MTGRAKKPLGFRGKKKQKTKTLSEPKLSEAQYQSLLEAKGQLTIFDALTVEREKDRQHELRLYEVEKEERQQDDSRPARAKPDGRRKSAREADGGKQARGKQARVGSAQSPEPAARPVEAWDGSWDGLAIG
jgi:hypothetical protein